jgi:hypothetical protein
MSNSAVGTTRASSCPELKKLVTVHRLEAAVTADRIAKIDVNVSAFREPP